MSKKYTYLYKFPHSIQLHIDHNFLRPKLVHIHYNFHPSIVVNTQCYNLVHSMQMVLDKLGSSRKYIMYIPRVNYFKYLLLQLGKNFSKFYGKCRNFNSSHKMMKTGKTYCYLSSHTNYQIYILDHSSWKLASHLTGRVFYLLTCKWQQLQ